MSNPKKNIENIRVDYNKSIIDYNQMPDSPFELFKLWLDKAILVDNDNANAFVLSTVSSKGLPSSRVVLLRGLDNNGLTFFTNYNSCKSLNIDVNNNVSINFFWPQLEKQVRILGIASKISPDESDIYFNSRPKQSQLGALLSNQSTEISLDHDYTNHLFKLEAEHVNKEVIRPKYWGGYVVKPEYFEFWQGRPSRLHDRLCYSYENDSWLKTRKAP
jgi:pyridoxamine 5'-phosphate oxidase|tara:strand:+ start:6296 stop:6946 length:651 start_codon:yes stop_codon:yes gene_type:complete